jgi:hypothetical protein
MTIDAVFEHEDGYRFNQIYSKKNIFLRSLNKQRKATFVEAVDYDLAFIIRPSNLPEYRRLKA